MKKYVGFCFILLLAVPGFVMASSGSLVQGSIITCPSGTYGYHGKDRHYHKAILNEKGTYVAEGESLGTTPPCKVKEEENERESVILSSCVDGDTAKFVTKDGTFTTRFLAIDTPESVHPTKGEEPFGKEASEYTCNALKNAKEIVLEYDQGSEKKDKYQRLLAWVFVDGVLLQNELVKEGLAEVTYLYGNYKWTPTLQDSEAVAKAKKMKIWSDEVSSIPVSSDTKTTDQKEKSSENTSIFYYLGGTVLVIFCTVFGVSKSKRKKLLKEYKKLK